MKTRVIVSLKEGILDPEGKTISTALKNIGVGGIQQVNTGKVIELSFDTSIDADEAQAITEEACRKLLVNPNIETYHFNVVGETE